MFHSTIRVVLRNFISILVLDVKKFPNDTNTESEFQKYVQFPPAFSLVVVTIIFITAPVPWICCCPSYFWRHFHSHELNASQQPCEFNRWNDMILHIRKHTEILWDPLRVAQVGTVCQCPYQCISGVISTCYQFKTTNARNWKLFSAIIQPLGIILYQIMNRTKGSCILLRLEILVF